MLISLQNSHFQNKVPPFFNLINSYIPSLQFFTIRKIIWFIGCSLSLLPVYGQRDSATFVTYTYETGAKSSEGTLRNGKPDGYWKSYYRSGQLKTEGNRKNFLLDSVWVFYNEDGSKNLEITYKEDKKDGPRRYFKKGKRFKVEQWVGDKREGYAEEYDGQERLVRKIPYVNDREQGLGFEFDSTGTIITLLTYKSSVLVRKEAINRVDQSGMKQATWMEFYPDLITKVEGNYRNDLKHGYWKYYKPNGSLIKTEKWVNGVLDENAQETIKLDIKRTVYANGRTKTMGGYLNGVPEGVHRTFDEDGRVASGMVYHKGRKTAEGITDEAGLRQGPWKFFLEDGTLTAEGSYKDNLRVGNWKYYYPSGKVEQVGLFVRDQPDGEWNWYYENGNTWRTESYVLGEADGLSTSYAEDGTVLAQGQYIEGEKDGPWLEVVGSYKEEGSYFEGKRTGKWKGSYKDGSVKWEGVYSNGLEDGTFVDYYSNGNPDWRGQYVAGVKEGIWEYFDESGARYLTIEYVNGQEEKYNGVKISYGRRLDKRLERGD